MKLLELYQDYSIPHATENHKHSRPGWVNTSCPFCTGNPGLHLGYDLTGNHYYCWRCGYHSTTDTLMALLKLPYHKVKALIIAYKGSIYQIAPKVEMDKVEHVLPSGIIPLHAGHRKYLIGRGFDPDQLIEDWGLLGTGPIAMLDNIDYKHRILAPIIWNEQQVSFQTRMIKEPNKPSDLKYITCPKNRELIDHKHILYGKQEFWGDTGICVEGITDVWKLGFNAFATFGIEFTRFQVRLIAKSFKRVCIIFDDEPQAQIQAKKLMTELKFLNVDAFTYTIVGDPGSLTQTEANNLVKSIL